MQPEKAEEPEQPDETKEPEAAEPETPEEPAAPETVTFTDDCGRTVELPASINRVVPTGALSQIALFPLAPEMFVGVANNWSDAAKQYVPEEYHDLPVLGSLYGTADLNVEQLALADPASVPC